MAPCRKTLKGVVEAEHLGKGPDESGCRVLGKVGAWGRSEGLLRGGGAKGASLDRRVNWQCGGRAEEESPPGQRKAKPAFLPVPARPKGQQLPTSAAQACGPAAGPGRAGGGCALLSVSSFPIRSPRTHLSSQKVHGE